MPKWLREVLEHFMAQFLIVFALSLAAAYVCFQIGSSIAEITGQKNTSWGISFEAGGMLAGFFLTLGASVCTIKHLWSLAQKHRGMHLTVFLVGKPRRFDRGTNYVCTYTLYNTETGLKSLPLVAQVGWEAGLLTVTVRDAGPNDKIRIRVTDENEVWECEDFPSRSRKVECLLLPGEVSKE